MTLNLPLAMQEISLYLFPKFLFIAANREASQTTKLLTEVPTTALSLASAGIILPFDYQSGQGSSKRVIPAKQFQNSDIYKLLIAIFGNFLKTHPSIS